MPKPLSSIRKEKRNKKEIKQDIETTNKILREDIYDILKELEGKTKEEAIAELRDFLTKIDSDAIKYQGDKDKGIERVLSDIDSYGIEFKK